MTNLGLQADRSAAVWQDVWTINAMAAVTRLGSIGVYIRLVDAVSGNIGYHQVATLTVLARNLNVASLRISIRANGELSAEAAQRP